MIPDGAKGREARVARNGTDPLFVFLRRRAPRSISFSGRRRLLRICCGALDR